MAWIWVNQNLHAIFPKPPKSMGMNRILLVEFNKSGRILIDYMEM